MAKFCNSYRYYIWKQVIQFLKTIWTADEIFLPALFSNLFVSNLSIFIQWPVPLLWPMAIGKCCIEFKLGIKTVFPGISVEMAFLFCKIPQLHSPA